MSRRSELSSLLSTLLERERLPTSMLETIENVHAPLAEHIAARAAGHAGPFIVGVCGPQGSGKSTLTAIVRELLTARDRSAAVLSLDDVYLRRADRAELARRVHPLLATRGVPGTHDIDLTERTFDALRDRGTVAMPSFDKARDDRRPIAEWPTVTAPVDIILFEGWCVGASPEEDAALREPINELEREHDAQGIWRRHVNAELGSRYRALFARLDELVLLQAPSFEVIYGWRAEQERKLRERIEREGGDGSRLMDESALRYFISHYERLTRHILSEMPARADVIVGLDAERRARGLIF